MRTVRRALLVLFLAGALTGAPAGAPPAPGLSAGTAGATERPGPGTHERTLTMDGVWERDYLLHVPPGRAGRRPLVIALHGGLNDMRYMRESTGLDAVADANGFLVAYPDGFMRTWNAGGCCWFARMAGIDDVAFLDRLIDTLAGQGLADPRRIYLTGFSNGGGMAYRYACERARRVAAVGVVSGSLAVRCAPDAPVRVIAFHGTADFSVPYDGGGNQDWNNKDPFPPVSAVMDFWRSVGGLAPLDRITLETARTTCRTTGRGRTGAEVELCTVREGGHEWPGGQGADPELRASPLIWRFFSDHARNG
ncbi:alpha/beta hydrolase family esterase [Actinomadura viridis]|uniref:Polyhydroxybutyrate depolymerase n=1 Tax=Actinomadura viridis TaxID=58110 RepID=A0A931DPW9_9ACTN|nr:PHB depolymerase family esterase [Actinomadura viridis]MBG6091857.1 polyhydroxybutyrate depolymerase [Actinomadura viridis]